MQYSDRLQTIKECDLVDVIVSMYEGKTVNLKALIDDIDWLIEQAEKVEKELNIFNIQSMKEKIERLERVNSIAIHLMTNKQLEKLKQLS